MQTITAHSITPTSSTVQTPPWQLTLMMLISRLGLFAVFQAVIAAAYLLQGNTGPWEGSIAWWPITATLASLTSLMLLSHLFKREGLRYRDLFRLERATLGLDLLLVLGVLVVSVLLAVIPNLGLSTLLWGNAERGAELFIRPLPAWAASLTLLLFPLTVGLSELPTYYAYVLPRLQRLSGSFWLALTLSALFLALQHATLPLIFDVSFLLWRALMFLPFALFLALILTKRPRLLPYLMLVHVLLDFAAAWQVYGLSVS